MENFHPIFTHLDAVHRISQPARSALNAIMRTERYAKSDYIQRTGNSCRNAHLCRKL
jgi:hypothetical protein